jgi:hypothetical protein
VVNNVLQITAAAGVSGWGLAVGCWGLGVGDGSGSSRSYSLGTRREELARVITEAAVAPLVCAVCVVCTVCVVCAVKPVKLLVVVAQVDTELMAESTGDVMPDIDVLPVTAE